MAYACRVVSVARKRFNKFQLVQLRSGTQSGQCHTLRNLGSHYAAEAVPTAPADFFDCAWALLFDYSTKKATLRWL
jgi:hypothetical protein